MEREGSFRFGGSRLEDSPVFSFDAVALEKLAKSGAPDLGAAFDDSAELIEKSGLGEKEKLQLNKLLRDAKRACRDYVGVVLEQSEASEMSLPDDAADRGRYQLVIAEIDKRRRQAHLAYADALNILFRNMIKFGIAEAAKYAAELAGDPASPEHRRKIADAAVLYAWKKNSAPPESEEK